MTLRSTAYIGLGSNLGDSLRLVREAWEALGRNPAVTPGRLSSPYRSEPVGMVSDLWFINGVGQVRTSLSPLELLEYLLALEQAFGRRRRPGAQVSEDRTLDLDLLLYDDLILPGPRLVLPHPELHRRLFVLMPLAEIAPRLRHPVLGQSMQELLQARLAEGDLPACQQTAWPGTGPR